LVTLVGPSASLLRFAEGAKNIKIVGQGPVVDKVKYTWFFDPSTGERRLAVSNYGEVK
jgi:hypothetical protein